MPIWIGEIRRIRKLQIEKPIPISKSGNKSNPRYGSFHFIGVLYFLQMGHWYWTYSVTQLPVEFQWHWHVSNAEISIIRTINIHILMKFMIKMIDLIDVIPYMAVMTDISAFDTCKCHRNSTGNWVTEYCHCASDGWYFNMDSTLVTHNVRDERRWIP